MKVMTPEEDAAHNKVVLRGGVVGGVLGLGVGLGSVMLASRRYAVVRSLTLPFKSFIISSSSIFGFVVNAEASSAAFARSHEPMAGYRDSSQRAADIVRENKTTYEAFMDWGRDNRYRLVFASWLASMGIALALVNRSPLTKAQKLVQARVYAQGLTVGVLVLSAVFEMSDAKAGSGRWQTVKILDPNDPEHKRIIEKRVHKEEYEGQDLWQGESPGRPPLVSARVYTHTTPFSLGPAFPCSPFPVLHNPCFVFSLAFQPKASSFPPVHPPAPT